MATPGPPRAEKLIFSDKTLACSNDCAPKHKEVQMEVMVAVGEGMENGDVRGIKMVTKEVDEEIWTIAMRI